MWKIPNDDLLEEMLGDETEHSTETEDFTTQQLLEEIESLLLLVDQNRKQKTIH